MENLLVACSRSNWPIRSLLEKVGARLDLIFGEIVAQVPINNVMSGEDGIVWLAFSNYAGKGMRMSIPIAAVHGSVVDAVDGSFTGTSVPWMWAPLRLPRFKGASHADDDDNRFRYREVGFQVHGVDAGGRSDCSPATEASLCPDILPEAVALSCRYRSLRLGAPLVAQAQALGHTVRLMPPAYVKPYVKRQKNDAFV